VPRTSSARGKVGAIDVAAYWIDKYSRCKEEQIDYAERIAAGFASAMNWMGHRVEFTRGSADASPNQWDAWLDRSQYGIDTVQFVYLATHGATYGKEGPATPTSQPPNNWVYFWLFTFNSPDGCFKATVAARQVQNPRTLRWSWEPTSISPPTVIMRLAGWRFELAREMKAAGLPVDMNKAL
jgi:hypothetical protein